MSGLSSPPTPLHCVERGLLILAAGLALSVQGQVPASHLIVITGLGGELGYRRSLDQWATVMIAGARRLGVPDSSIIYLAGDSATTGVRRATRENVAAVIRQLPARSRSGDVILILLAGHGSHEGAESRLNLPGPDLTAADLAQLLQPLADRRLVVVNAASASGDFIAALSAPGRVVMTATKSSFERNATQFGRHWVNAFAGDGADVDKDGRVSMLEAFLYAKRETVRAYQSDNRLLTEHAMLDDDGDGAGSAAPGATGNEGSLARTVFLGRRSVTVAATDSSTAALLRAKEALEARIAGLRGRKSSMAEPEYERQLEALLVELALTNEALRAKQAPP